jgi:hypothetical protein
MEASGVLGGGGLKVDFASGRFGMIGAVVGEDRKAVREVIWFGVRWRMRQVS